MADMSKLVFLNGALIPEGQAMIPVQDRGFLYGDGLFETLRVSHGRVFRWGSHWQRLSRGLDLLRIRLPFDSEALGRHAADLIAANSLQDGLLRLAVSRGIGHRGYSPRGADSPTLVMTVTPALAPALTQPLAWWVILSRHRLPGATPLSECKTANKLLQVLARMEADDAGRDEALLTDADGFLAEGTSGNLFWIRDGAVEHPPEEVGALPGVSGGVIRELCLARGVPIRSARIRPADLVTTQGAFLTMSTLGVVRLVGLDELDLPRSPLVDVLWQDYQVLVDAETRV